MSYIIGNKCNIVVMDIQKSPDVSIEKTSKVQGMWQGINKKKN